MKNTLIALLLLIACAAAAQSANQKTVLNNYVAFGKGDVPTIIASFAETCTWTHPGNATVPFAGVFRGHAGLAQFFETVRKSVEITAFEPSNFQESGNQISNDMRITGKVLSTGKSYESNVVFTWTFDADGKAIAWIATGDVSTLEAALAGK